MKGSGLEREMGPEGLDAFLELQSKLEPRPLRHVQLTEPAGPLG